MLYNPLEKEINKSVTIDLYYTGLKDNAMIGKEDGPYEKIELTDKTILDLNIQIPAKGWTWFILK